MPRLLFEKKGDSVWISHLDLMRVFQRAFRRAGLLLKHSQGFTPRAIVSIALPLSVGVDSCCELLDYELEQDAVVTPELLNEKLPAGIRVLEIIDNGRKIKELTHLRAAVTLSYDNGVPADLQERLSELFGREEVIIEKHSRKGKTETNILPMLTEWKLEQTADTTAVLEVLVCAQNPSLNPQLLVTAMELYAEDMKPDHAVVHRLEIYDREGKVFR
jgi:radical SAM-linked protein